MHLWFHPTNLADETDAMLAGLRNVFAEVARRRERAELDVLPMGELAAREATGDPPGKELPDTLTPQELSMYAMGPPVSGTRLPLTVSPSTP